MTKRIFLVFCHMGCVLPFSRVIQIALSSGGGGSIKSEQNILYIAGKGFEGGGMVVGGTHVFY